MHIRIKYSFAVKINSGEMDVPEVEDVEKYYHKFIWNVLSNNHQRWKLPMLMTPQRKAK